MSMSRVGAICTLLEAELDTPPSTLRAVPLPKDCSDPAITVQEIGGPEGMTLEGRNGLSRKVMQVNVWSHDIETASALREEIKDILCDYKGAAGDLTIAGIATSSDHSLYDGLRELHQYILSILVWWEME